MLSGVPILVEQCLNVDNVAVLLNLRIKGMTGPHLDLRADRGNRGNVSGHA